MKWHGLVEIPEYVEHEVYPFMTLESYMDQHNDLDPVGDLGLAPYNRWVEVEDAEPVWMRDIEFSKSDVLANWNKALEFAKRASFQASEPIHLQAVVEYLNEVTNDTNAVLAELEEDESPLFVKWQDVIGMSFQRQWQRIHNEMIMQGLYDLVNKNPMQVPQIRLLASVVGARKEMIV